MCNVKGRKLQFKRPALGQCALHWANLIESFWIKFVWVSGPLHTYRKSEATSKQKLMQIYSPYPNPDWNQSQTHTKPNSKPDQTEPFKCKQVWSRRWICLFTFWGCIIGYLSSNLTNFKVFQMRDLSGCLCASGKFWKSFPGISCNFQHLGKILHLLGPRDTESVTEQGAGGKCLQLLAAGLHRHHQRWHFKVLQEFTEASSRLGKQFVSHS